MYKDSAIFSTILSAQAMLISLYISHSSCTNVQKIMICHMTTLINPMYFVCIKNSPFNKY